MLKPWNWRFTLTDDTKEQEICYTIWKLERVLKEWGLNDTRPSTLVKPAVSKPTNSNKPPHQH